MAATASCYPEYDHQASARTPTTHPHKDYSRPLHVDCSVEYELPNAAKPPAGGRSEPLLMIHPCYYRRAESQRRSPFINNLPAPRRTSTTAYQSVRYVDPARQAAAAGKRDPLLCSSADSGHWTDTERSPLVPQAVAEQPRLPPAGPDSGIATPLTDDKINLPGSTCTWTGNTSHRPAEPVSQPSNQTVQPYYLQLLAATCAGEVNNNSLQGSSVTTGGGSTGGPGPGVGSSKESARLSQPAVGVAAVAASCKACHPQGGFLQPQMRGAAVQQPWPGVTAPAVSSGGPGHHHHLHGGRLRSGRGGSGAAASAAAAAAAEPGPEHAATSTSLHHRRQAAAGWARAAKRSRVSTTPGTAPWPPPACCKGCQQWNDENSRVLWNNDSVLRLFQV